MVDLVYPSLVQKYKENNIVTEAADPVQGRHLYHKRENVVDERVEEFVGQHTPWKMGDALELVIDKQLRRHHDKSECQQKSVKHTENPGVPSLVLQVHQGVDRVSAQQGIQRPREISEGQSVVFLRRGPHVRAFVLECYLREDAEYSHLPINVDVYDLVDLPHFDA